MEHADKLIERILMIDGMPYLQSLGELRIGENVKELLECDLALELDALPPLRDGIVHCEAIRDFVSREILVDILENEEDHVDFLETQLTLIGQMGQQNYVLSATGGQTPDSD